MFSNPADKKGNPCPRLAFLSKCIFCMKNKWKVTLAADDHSEISFVTLIWTFIYFVNLWGFSEQ